MTKPAPRRRKPAPVRRPPGSLRMRWWQWALLGALAAGTTVLVVAALLK
ncbi:hypothetical protein EDF52_1202 [Curtobacterium sp. PhB42]|nr:MULTISPECIES: hypothetical protein [unclassified Curtobacterium]TDW39676.1 hypothetical protein EDF52_1202 [Curtobacterium sp. PhB42]TDW50783.1 hypothetical protein EDF47_1152 [Curtobacterium sp. PhB190]